MQLKRRNLLKGVLAVGAAPALASSGNETAEPKKVVQIRPGFYSVNGWVVTEQELRNLRKDGIC